MNTEFERARILQLRASYDMALKAPDPVSYAYWNQNLLHSIAEFLIQPLQEHEMAERSKLPKKRTRKKNEK